MNKKLIIGFVLFSVVMTTIMFVLDQQRIANYEKAVKEVVMPDNQPDDIKPIDPESGLVIASGLSAVKTNCLRCHSGKLIAQNRGTKDNWKSTILWMQETQNLWQLGDQEEIILDYLSTHYAPEATGRRKPLEHIDWYELKD